MRFPFYDKPWQITTIGNCCRSLDYGLGASAIDYDGKHKYIRITDIDEETNTFSNINITSPSYYDEEHKVKINDILFARTGASVGKTYCYNPKDGELYYAGFLIAAHVKNEFDPKFIFYNTVTTRYKNWVKIMSARSGQPGINADEYRSHTFYIPIKDEQLKISAFLSKLDERILLQNKIIEEYELLKNTINSHLIGNETPNIKISECMDCLSSSKKESDIINAPEGDYPAFGANGLIRKINTYDYQRPGISIVKDGAGVGRMSYLTGKYSIVGTQNLLINKSNYNLVYLYYALQNLDFRKYVVGSGIPHIYFKDYKNEYIYLPDNKKMINIISKCLSSIDVKISIENEVLDKLLKQKEYLLSNMFI